jgi:hypothetical protein
MKISQTLIMQVPDHYTDVRLYFDCKFKLTRALVFVTVPEYMSKWSDVLTGRFSSLLLFFSYAEFHHVFGFLGALVLLA